MARWRLRLFRLLEHYEPSAAESYGIPRDRVVDLDIDVHL